MRLYRQRNGEDVATGFSERTGLDGGYSGIMDVDIEGKVQNPLITYDDRQRGARETSARPSTPPRAITEAVRSLCWKCPFCLDQFENKDYLDLHTKYHHPHSFECGAMYVRRIGLTLRTK